MKEHKVSDQPGGSAHWEEPMARPDEEFDLGKVSPESLTALREAATLDEFKRSWLTIRIGRDAADYLLGPAE